MDLDRLPTSRLLAAKRSWLAVREGICAGVEGSDQDQCGNLPLNHLEYRKVF